MLYYRRSIGPKPLRIFPNDASLLRLVSALLAETSEVEETGTIHPAMIPSSQQPI